MSSIRISDAVGRDMGAKVLALLGVAEEDVEVSDVAGTLINVTCVAMSTCPRARKVRGVLVYCGTVGESPRILAGCFPMTEDVEVEDASLIPLFGPPFEGSYVTVRNAPEGTIVRYFFAPDEEGVPAEIRGKWTLSTMRRINAWRSKWEGPLFGTLFRDVFPAEKDALLDKSLFYVFLLRSPKTRLVCNYPLQPELILVLAGTASKCDELPVLPGVSVAISKRIEEPPAEIGFAEDCRETTGTLFTRFENGVPVRAIKVLVPGYSDAVQFRGGEASMRIVYLRARQCGQLSLFATYFADVDTSKYEAELAALLDVLEELYNKRYIRGMFLTTCREWHWILERARCMMNISGIRPKLVKAVASTEYLTVNKAINMLDSHKREIAMKRR